MTGGAQPRVRGWHGAALVAACALLAACGGAQERPAEAVGSEPRNGAAASVDDAAVHPWDGLAPLQVDGTITGASARDEQGHLFTTHLVEAQPGSVVRLRARSDAFDTMLTVDAGGVRFHNDDAWGVQHASLQIAVPAGVDRLLVAVSGFDPDAVGAYTLEFEPLTPARGPTLPLGEALTGALQGPNGGLGAPDPSATMWFEARAGERVRLRVTSPTVDVTATVLSPSGHTWFNDDANDDGEDGRERLTDATVRFVAPASGWYQLVVASFSGEPGNFRVRSTVEPPITVPVGAARPHVGYAGTETRGRVLGVYVGITDYGPSDQLPGCAEDADRAAAAMRDARLQGVRDQVVLTNAAATRAAVRDALALMARKARPDDVVVFFYSGHGTPSPVDEASAHGEIDGTDESIVLVDGNMSDNELASLADAITADTLLFVIDACHAGGFARDLIDRPGRVGFFSSDEDVLSSTAEPIDAGGYLSAGFIEAAAGGADARPRDTAVTIGELADFMTAFGVEYHGAMNPEASNAPMQRFVLERGSLTWETLLWVLPCDEGDPGCAASACGVDTIVAGDSATCR